MQLPVKWADTVYIRVFTHCCIRLHTFISVYMPAVLIENGRFLKGPPGLLSRPTKKGQD